jgi:integrase
VTKVIKVPESHLEVISSPLQESQPTALSQLKYAEPTELYLRDGEVVIRRRPGSPPWHCRFRLQDGSWHCQTTRQACIEQAVRMACDLYNETRFRQKLGLAQKSPTFAEIAYTTIYSMRQD